MKHYNSLDGLRALSCIGIMMMHIFYNTNYEISGIIWENVIPFFTWFVFLFLMISGFGMCAGYLEKFQNKEIDLENFYKRRYKKILPYFIFLIIVALFVEPSITNFFDATIEVTLLFGLLPNNALNVIGVGLTLGVIFLFYLLFPVFTVLLKTKKRALIWLLIFLWITFICENHYFSDKFVNELFTSRHNFLYCLPLFMIGGIIFLFRENISNVCLRFRFILLLLVVVITVISFYIPKTINNFDIHFYTYFFVFSSWLIYAVGVESKILSNKIMKFFSDISLEFYLSHMFVFRTIEKLHFQYLFGKGWASYIFTCFIVTVGLIALILTFKFCYKNIVSRIFTQKQSNSGEPLKC